MTHDSNGFGEVLTHEVCQQLRDVGSDGSRIRVVLVCEKRDDLADRVRAVTQLPDAGGDLVQGEVLPVDGIQDDDGVAAAAPDGVGRTSPACVRLEALIQRVRPAS
jgi:hypothetical protein